MKKYLLAAASLAALSLMASGSYGQTAKHVNLCTGAENGVYWQAGQMIAQQAQLSRQLDVAVVPTKGTWENINRPDCDAFIGQPDGMVKLKHDNPSAAGQITQLGTLHREYLHVLCSRESGVTALEDLPGLADAKVALGAVGSGPWLIWQNFIAEDESYSSVKVTDDAGAIALNAVASGDVTCMLAGSGLPNPLMTKANATLSDKVVLVKAQDKDFNDAVDIKGNPLYTWDTIPSGTYPDIQDGTFSDSVATISWNAGVYLRKASFDDKSLQVMADAVLNARGPIISQFGK
jgi:TRAP-type uncharacterized transport system substrate-binding protein